MACSGPSSLPLCSLGRSGFSAIGSYGQASLGVLECADHSEWQVAMGQTCTGATSLGSPRAAVANNQTGWLRDGHWFIPRGRSPEVRCRRVGSLGGSTGNCPWGCSLDSTRPFPLSQSLLSFLLQGCWSLGLGPSLNPGCSHFESLDLITSTKTLFPNKVTFTDNGVRTWIYPLWGTHFNS